MRGLTLLLVAVLMAAYTSAAFSQELMNNIIRFGSPEARRTYVNLLKQQNPNVDTTEINNLFIGLITKHDTRDAFSAESSRLQRIYASGEDSILSYEQDQEVNIDLSSQPSPPWHLDRINQRALPLDNAFKFDGSEENVNIYIADTGIRVSHNEFEGRAAGAFSAVSGNPAGQDCHGHGTHVAALTGGRTYGVSKNAKIWDVRVLDCRGSGSTSGILQGMNWIAANARKPAVVNMSLGGSYSASLNSAINTLFNAGILPIVAAGNENTNACTKSPASAPNAFTVGSTTNRDARSSFSNYGTCVNMYSPGSSILSAGITSDTSTATMSGTSMASPVAAGVAAYYLSKNPSFSPAQLKELMLQTATSTVSSNIRPFVFYNPSGSQPQPEPVPEPVNPDCPEGYTGDNCLIPICGGVAANHPDVCSGRGYCASPNTCVCNNGFFGSVCQTERSEDPEDPEEPGKPGKGMVVAFILGDVVKTVKSGESLVLDASLSHTTTELNNEMCSSDDQDKYEFSYNWRCESHINNSNLNAFCGKDILSKNSRIVLSEEDVQQLKNEGPIVFTVTARVAGYTSQAKTVVIVQN